MDDSVIRLSFQIPITFLAHSSQSVVLPYFSTSNMTSTRIAELAVTIQENTFKVDNYMNRQGLPSPSFDEDGPVDFKINSPEIEEARIIAIDSTLELHQLLLGPALCLRPVVSMVQENSTARALLDC